MSTKITNRNPVKFLKNADGSYTALHEGFSDIHGATWVEGLTFQKETNETRMEAWCNANEQAEYEDDLKYQKSEQYD